LNIHQWPEDFEAILGDAARTNMRAPALVQWLELMPSPDWMCRSELMSSPLRKLAEDSRFELRFVTLSEYLEEASAPAGARLASAAATPRAAAIPEREYTLGEVFHGLSLGKNGDLFRRLSAETERALLDAEVLATIAGRFGRPYAQWDVYPTWELEEGWRELLGAQHHDNDECEGLCGHVGRRSYERSAMLARHVILRTLEHLHSAAGGEEEWLVFNPLDRPRAARLVGEGEAYRTPEIPPLGYRLISPEELTPIEPVTLGEQDGRSVMHRGAVSLSVDHESGEIVNYVHPEFPPGSTDGRPLCRLRVGVGVEAGEWARQLRPEAIEVKEEQVDGESVLRIRRRFADGYIDCDLGLSAEDGSAELRVHSNRLPELAEAHAGALVLFFPWPSADPQALSARRVIHDHPYAVDSIAPTGRFTRKYPTGEWMTSSQRYESIEHPFTSLSFVDVPSDDRGSYGLQIIHDGSQSHFFEETGLAVVLSLNDPWDEAYFVRELDAGFRLRPHGPATSAELWAAASSLRRPLLFFGPGYERLEAVQLDREAYRRGLPEVPRHFSLVEHASTHVRVTAAYRETEEGGRLFDDYAGEGLGFPQILRLVELDGRSGEVDLRVSGRVEYAAKTNALGELLSPCINELVEENISRVRVELAAHEIATVYLDIAEARKIPRNLDEHREIWATAHRPGDRKDENETQGETV
jgi:alpha-mannosidase